MVHRDKMKIRIFTTGGTIDNTYFDQKNDYHVGEPQAAGVLERANVFIDYDVVEILRKDSLDLTDADRSLIKSQIESDTAEKVIITHGTDTMIKTAKCLKSISGKTIVLTGSMYPAQYRDSDAIFNMGCALIAVQTLKAGVYIAMNGCIFEPEKAMKNVELNRFEKIK